MEIKINRKRKRKRGHPDGPAPQYAHQFFRSRATELRSRSTAGTVESSGLLGNPIRNSIMVATE